jgi:hypothetical protein
MNGIEPIEEETSNLGVHVRLCAQRHEQIRSAFKEVRALLWGLIGFLLVIHHDRIPELVQIAKAAFVP